MQLLGYQIVDQETNDIPDDFSSMDVIKDVEILNEFFQDYMDIHEEDECPYIVKPIFDKKSQETITM